MNINNNNNNKNNNNNNRMKIIMYKKLIKMKKFRKNQLKLNQNRYASLNINLFIHFPLNIVTFQI